MKWEKVQLLAKFISWINLGKQDLKIQCITVLSISGLALELKFHHPFLLPLLLRPTLVCFTHCLKEGYDVFTSFKNEECSILGKSGH